MDLVKSTIEDGVDGIVAKELQSRGNGGDDSTLECDYDINPTELYLAVQDGRWDDVLNRSKTHPHEASTWVYRQEGAMKQLRWRLLPLHAAVIFRAPKEAVIALLVANSDSAACRDDQGKVPLHLSLRRRSGDAEFDEEVVSILTKAYPEGTRAPDNEGRTPFDIVEGYTNVAVRTRLLRCLRVNQVKKEGQRSPLYTAALKKRQAKEARIDSELRAKLERQRYTLSPKRNHCSDDDQNLAGEDDIGVEVEYDANKRMSTMSEKEEYDVDEMMMQEVVEDVNEQTLSQTLDHDNNDQVEVQCTMIPVHQSTTPPLVRMAPPSLRDQMRARLEMRRPTGGGDDLLLRADCSKRDIELPPSSPPTDRNIRENTIKASNNSDETLLGTTSEARQGNHFVEEEKDALRERTDQIQTDDRNDISETLDDRRESKIDSSKPQTNAYVKSLLDTDDTSSLANSEHGRDQEFHRVPSVTGQIRTHDDESRTNWITNDNRSRQNNELSSTPAEVTSDGGFRRVLPSRNSVEEANTAGTSTLSVRSRILEMDRIGHDNNIDRLGRGMFMLGNSNHSVSTVSSSICSSTTGGASSTTSRGRRIELNKCDMRLRTLETMTEKKDETSEYMYDHPSFYQSPSCNLPSSYISNEWKMKYNCSPTEASTQDTQISEIHATEDYADRYNIVKSKFEKVKNETRESHLAKGCHSAKSKLDLQAMFAPRSQHRTSLDELEVYNCASMITAPTDDITENPSSSIYEEGSISESYISQSKQVRSITVSDHEDKKTIHSHHNTSRLLTCESDIDDKYDLDDENATPKLLKKAEHFFDSLNKDNVSHSSFIKSRGDSGSARSKFEMIMAKYENISSNGEGSYRSVESSQSCHDFHSNSSSRRNKYHTSRDNLIAASNEYGLDSSPTSFKGSKDVSRSSTKSLYGCEDVFRNTNIEGKLLPQVTTFKSHVVDQLKPRLQPSCSKDSTEFIMSIPQVRSFESDAVSALSMITGNTSIGSVSISTENSAVIESYVKSVVHNIVAYEVENTGSMKKELDAALRTELKLKAQVKKLAKQSHEISIRLKKERKANRIAEGKFNQEMEIHLAKKASEYEKYCAIAMGHAEKSKRRALELAQQDMEKEITLLKSQLDSVQSIGVPIDKSLQNALGLVESNQVALRQAAKRDAESAREMKDEVERSFMDAVAEFDAWSEKQLQLMEARWTA